ncbi:MAG: hypothetical protein MI921_05080 [Cytophagales bacterium]|nr:hypothetical protein [Cytophagales bacterium]
MLIQPDSKPHRDHLRTLNSWQKPVTGKVYDCRVTGEWAALLKTPAAERIATLIGELPQARLTKKFLMKA